MSRYSIYRIDHFDPALAGKERKTTESLVLADKPLEKKPDTSIAGTLTTLRKFIATEITIDSCEKTEKKEGRKGDGEKRRIQIHSRPARPA